jgi:hypothetical protein
MNFPAGILGNQEQRRDAYQGRAASHARPWSGSRDLKCGRDVRGSQLDLSGELVLISFPYNPSMALPWLL